VRYGENAAQLKVECRRRTRVVIRSTMPPRSTEELQNAWSELEIVHWPEFLTEATAVHDGISPSRVVIGYTDRSVGAAAQLLDLVHGAPFVELVKATDAELIKYFANSFYAVKVAWANQFYELCEKLGGDYEVVRRCAEHDPMTAPYHLDVHHKGYRGYGGKCLPKDTKALLWCTTESGIEADLSVLAAADAYNSELIARKR